MDRKKINSEKDERILENKDKKYVCKIERHWEGMEAKESQITKKRKRHDRVKHKELRNEKRNNLEGIGGEILK